jgi:hypothetical protein
VADADATRNRSIHPRVKRPLDVRPTDVPALPKKIREKRVK